jgi:hypothetical protein
MGILLTTDELICITCGHAYGLTRAEIHGGHPPYTEKEAGLAAKLTGWYKTDEGWLCGIVPCVPPPWVNNPQWRNRWRTNR